ncbi:hybrid sensor histidine kinase/response regulator (plasmid) [Fulvitalea axinellae]|uniref:histidine kinase n=1 Tax=Fulvitalea axinellae TaxID=1182444 RepID=A0AAU9DJT1_9BACT|nr:hybrid sensor histidine kinase/response regulator [Fulvitalea axinellae]
MRDRILFAVFFVINLSLGFCCAAKASVPENQGYRKVLTLRGELSSLVVHDIEKDRSGVMWIATEEGVTLFDGEEVRELPAPEQRQTPLRRRVTSLYFQKSINRMWIGTGDGLLWYDMDMSRYTEVPESEVRGIYVNSIFGSEDNIFISTGVGEISRWNPEGNRFHRISDALTLRWMDDRAAIRPLLVTRGGELWFTDSYGNIYRLPKGVAEQRKVRIGKIPLSESETVQFLYEDGYGNIWLGLSMSGIWRLNDDDDLFDKYPVQGLSDKEQMNFQCVDHYGDNLYVGTLEKGILIMDLPRDPAEGLKLAGRILPEEQGGVLSYRHISGVYSDVLGQVWAIPVGTGVDFLKKEDNSFRLLSVSEDGEGLPYRKVQAVCEDEKNNVWFVTEQGLSRKDGKTGKIKNYNLNTHGLDHGILTSGCSDRSGRFWLGTASGTLLYYEESKDRFTVFPLESVENRALESQRIETLYEDGDGSLWVSKRDWTVTRIDYKRKNTQQVSLRKGSFLSRSVSGMAQTREGLFVGGSDASFLARWEQGIGGFSPLSLPNSSLEDADFSEVYALSADRRGVIWVGAKGGKLYSFDPATKRLKAYRQDGKPVFGRVLSILHDDRDRVWMATDKSISMLERESGKIYHFFESDGIAPPPYVENAACRLRDGRLCFGSKFGALILDPDKIDIKAETPEVTLKSLVVSGKRVFPGDQGSPLKKALTETESVRLNNEQRNIGISYACVDYVRQDAIRFAYRLVGLDSAWNYAGRQNTVNFSNLPSGEYTFEIKARVSGGEWSPEPRRLHITVDPPLWATWYAYLSYVLAIVGVVFFYGRFTSNQAVLKYRVSDLERKREEEHQGYLDRMNFYTNIAHELRTPLTLVVGPLEELMHTVHRGGVRDKVKRAYRNSNTLLKLTDQLMAFRRLEEGVETLRPEYLDFVSFVREISRSFVSEAKRSGLTLDFVSDTNKYSGWFDGEKVGIILRNLIENAIKYTPEGGAVTVDIKVDQENDKLLLAVKDTGIGMDDEDRKHVFDRFYRSENTAGIGGTGIGLALVKRLADLHSAKIVVKSELGSGSVFELEMSLKKKKGTEEEPVAEKREVSAPVSFPEPKPKSEPEPIVEEEPVEVENKAKPRMMIVEDDNEMRVYLTEIFADKFEVLSVPGGKEALEDLKTKTLPDVVISDVMMPGMDGFTLCRRIKIDERTSHLPVVMLTAKAREDEMIEGMEHGADDYITKPFNTKVLKMKVDNLLRSRSQLSAYLLAGKEKAPEQHLSQDEKFARKVIDLIEKGMGSPDFKVEDICEALRMSRSSLYSKVRKATGMSIVEFIRYVRLGKAARMLREEDRLGVSEIAYKVGFSDLKYFRSVFKKRFACSPSEYRKQEEELPQELG